MAALCGSFVGSAWFLDLYLVMMSTGHQVWPWEGVQGFGGINGGVQVTYPK